MKLFTINLFLFIIISSTYLTGCKNSAEQNLDKAKESVIDAKKDLDQAKLDSKKNYIKFKEESEAILKENDKRINELKIEITKEKKETRLKYATLLQDLEKKNTQLRTKMLEYKFGSIESWESFKLVYNQDLEELKYSISAIYKRNKKTKYKINMRIM